LDSRAEEKYQQGHIQGALNFPEAWTYHHKNIDGRIVQPTALQKILRKLGLNTDTPVVIYDSGQMMNAARLFWTLEVYGLKNVSILNKGYADWLSLNLPLELETPTHPASHYIPVINHERLATKLTTLLATKNPNQLIIDARPNPAYRGLESSAKRFGHIPKARNMPASHNLTQEAQMTSLKSLDELKGIYADIPKNQKVVLYCAIGRISTMNYFTLRELGYNVANYDASWKEWGNDFSLAIVKETPGVSTDKVDSKDDY
jgi:thiosulfate/3-mercaptopyruvate sulfurtransferase